MTENKIDRYFIDPKGNSKTSQSRNKGQRKEKKRGEEKNEEKRQ